MTADTAKKRAPAHHERRTIPWRLHFRRQPEQCKSVRWRPGYGGPTFVGGCCKPAPTWEATRSGGFAGHGSLWPTLHPCCVPHVVSRMSVVIPVWTGFAATFAGRGVCHGSVVSGIALYVVPTWNIQGLAVVRAMPSGVADVCLVDEGSRGWNGAAACGGSWG